MRLAVLVAASLLVGLAVADPSFDEDWKTFKVKFNKTYHVAHEPKRRKHFEDKLRAIKKHNEAASSTYHMGVNHFSDWSDDELLQLTGYQPLPRNATSLPSPANVTSSNRQLPSYVDWRGDPCIAPVRDQQTCSACYAFAATAALEFPLCKAIGYLKPLSEQQLIDCARQNGCTSGRYEASWDFAYYQPGMASRAAYPYVAAAGTCRSVTVNPSDRPSGWYYIPNEDAMAYEVASYGPIAVGFHAVSNFFSYKSGIYSDSSCSSTCQQANHAFTVVGYGSQNGYPFWIIRNSWTTKWGELGYGKVARGRNMCNIACWAARVYV